MEACKDNVQNNRIDLKGTVEGDGQHLLYGIVKDIEGNCVGQ